MDFNRPLHICLFAIVFGFLTYLASAIWSALFIVTLPMDDGAIVAEVEIPTGEDSSRWEITEFKNGMEHWKYVHNLRMRVRNRYLLWGRIAIGSVASWLGFYLIPKLRKTLDQSKDHSELFIGSIVFGVVVALIVPAFFLWILPAPIKWLPSELTEINELRQKEALERLRPLAESEDRSRESREGDSLE